MHRDEAGNSSPSPPSMKITPPPPPPSANIDTGRMSQELERLKQKKIELILLMCNDELLLVVQICSHVYVLL